MEEDEDVFDGDSEEVAFEVGVGEGEEKIPAWAIPARRMDDIGRLARRLSGSRGMPPDFTAAVPLVDAVRAALGDTQADALVYKISALLLFVSADSVNGEDRNLERLAERFKYKLVQITMPYIYDFVSACGIMALIVQKAAEPPAPVETRTANVELVYCRISTGYGPGDRVRMPDGRRGVVVVRRDKSGMAGVMPQEDSGEGGMSKTDPTQG